MPPEAEGEMLDLSVADEDQLGGEVKGWSSKQMASSCEKDEMGDVELSKEELAALEEEVGGASGDDVYLDLNSQELFQDGRCCV